MDKKIIVGGALAGLMVTATLAGTVLAQDTATATSISAEQAIEIARAEVEGKIEEVEREHDDGIEIFEIEIVTAENKEFEVEINAMTGEVLEVEAEDDEHDEEDDDHHSD